MSIPWNHDGPAGLPGGDSVAGTASLSSRGQEPGPGARVLALRSVVENLVAIG